MGCSATKVSSSPDGSPFTTEKASPTHVPVSVPTAPQDSSPAAQSAATAPPDSSPAAQSAATAPPDSSHNDGKNTYTASHDSSPSHAVPSVSLPPLALPVQPPQAEHTEQQKSSPNTETRPILKHDNDDVNPNVSAAHSGVSTTKSEATHGYPRGRRNSTRRKSVIFASDVATVEFPNGDLYTGGMVDGKRHGFGVFKWATSHDVYEGNWHQNEKNGLGTLIWGNGDRYTGDYVAGLRCGSGEYHYAKGDVYDGEWKNDARHGYGVFTEACGNRYEGEWYADVKHGIGKFRWKASGEWFEGDWENDKKHGIGCQVYGPAPASAGVSSRLLLESHSQRNSPATSMTQLPIGTEHKPQNGPMLILSDGCIALGSADAYFGAWYQGSRHGYGVYSHRGGIGVFYGRYDKDKRILGSFVFENGDQYRGEWDGDAASGMGEMLYAGVTDGSATSYLGQWKDSLWHGVGFERHLDSTELIGTYEKEVLVRQLADPTHTDSSHKVDLNILRKCIQIVNAAISAAKEATAAALKCSSAHSVNIAPSSVLLLPVRKPTGM